MTIKNYIVAYLTSEAALDLSPMPIYEFKTLLEYSPSSALKVMLPKTTESWYPESSFYEAEDIDHTEFELTIKEVLEEYSFEWISKNDTEGLKILLPRFKGEKQLLSNGFFTLIKGKIDEKPYIRAISPNGREYLLRLKNSPSLNPYVVVNDATVHNHHLILSTLNKSLVESSGVNIAYFPKSTESLLEILNSQSELSSEIYVKSESQYLSVLSNYYWEEKK